MCNPFARAPPGSRVIIARAGKQSVFILCQWWQSRAHTYTLSSLRASFVSWGKSFNRLSTTVFTTYFLYSRSFKIGEWCDGDRPCLWLYSWGRLGPPSYCARAVFCSGNSQFARARLVKFYFLLNKKIKKELKDNIVWDCFGKPRRNRNKKNYCTCRVES